MAKIRKHIVDTTLRDGEQAPGVSFSREQKLRIADILDSAGVSQIEAGIPAAGEYEKETIRRILAAKKQARYSVWCRLSPDDVAHCLELGPDIVHLSIPVSYVHIYSKLRKNKQWVLNQLYACMGLLENGGLEVSVGFEDAFRSDISFMITLVRVLTDFGITRIRLADTVGVATPTQCRKTFEGLLDNGARGVQFGFHGHNDLGMALANTIEALKTCCTYADTTILGIGERAGNCDFYKLVAATGTLYEWGVRPTDAMRVEAAFGEITLRHSDD
ncbi:MAG: homocitrate synthase [Lachnospiraceae bacterium]|jgi:homocitrate synthase NifV|nr:homocitrate synthase [Lachnospiraceae bacterium]